MGTSRWCGPVLGWAAVWWLAAQAAACATPAPAQVQSLGAAALSCPPERVTVQSLSSRELVAAGCGKRAVYRCVSNSLTSVACASMQPDGPVEVEARIRDKASVLLRCGRAQLGALTDVGGGRYRISGCGRQVSYECRSQVDCCAFTEPGPRPVGEADPPQPRLEPGARAEIERGLRAEALPRVDACYQALLAQPPHATGVVTLRFVVDTDGRARGVRLVRSSLDDASTHACLVGALKGLRLAAPHPGPPIRVHYPIVLRTGPPWRACR